MAVLGTVAMVMLIVFCRLWDLQVLSANSIASGERRQRARPADRGAPRSDLDREGQPIVTSWIKNAVQIVPSFAAAGSATAPYRRLGRCWA